MRGQRQYTLAKATIILPEAPDFFCFFEDERPKSLATSLTDWRQAAVPPDRLFK